MLKNSVLAKTGQTWKLIAGVVGLVGGSGAMFFGLSRLSHGGMPWALGGIALGAVVGVWACVSVRCGRCGMRWVWKAIRTQEQLQWLNWLTAQRVCPRCGHSERP